MDRFLVGDKIRIINIDKGERAVCVILDILEDYSGDMYWVRYDDDRLGLECDTPNTVFVRYEDKINEIEYKMSHKIEKQQPQLH